MSSDLFHLRSLELYLLFYCIVLTTGHLQTPVFLFTEFLDHCVHSSILPLLTRASVLFHLDSAPATLSKLLLLRIDGLHTAEASRRFLVLILVSQQGLIQLLLPFETFSSLIFHDCMLTSQVLLSYKPSLGSGPNLPSPSVPFPSDICSSGFICCWHSNYFCVSVSTQGLSSESQTCTSVASSAFPLECLRGTQHSKTEFIILSVKPASTPLIPMLVNGLASNLIFIICSSCFLTLTPHHLFTTSCHLFTTSCHLCLLYSCQVCPFPSFHCPGPPAIMAKTIAVASCLVSCSLPYPI